VDLIERAFLEGQIDEVTAELAYCPLKAESTSFRSKRYPNCYPKRKRAN
jgi:hypothetical protein